MRPLQTAGWGCKSGTQRRGRRGLSGSVITPDVFLSSPGCRQGCQLGARRAHWSLEQNLREHDCGVCKGEGAGEDGGHRGDQQLRLRGVQQQRPGTRTLQPGHSPMKAGETQPHTPANASLTTSEVAEGKEAHRWDVSMGPALTAPGHGARERKAAEAQRGKRVACTDRHYQGCSPALPYFTRNSRQSH